MKLIGYILGGLFSVGMGYYAVRESASFILGLVAFALAVAVVRFVVRGLDNPVVAPRELR